MKKKVTAIIVVFVCLILFFPIRISLKDGGSVRYQALTYSITKVHSIRLEEEAIQGGKDKRYEEGFVVEILGIEVFDNVE